MKTSKYIIISFAMLLLSCQNAKQSDKTQEQKQEQSTQKISETASKSVAQWQINQDESSIHWTGYKMTEKVAVSGTFNTFEITGVKKSSNLNSILKNARIQINVNSIFSDEESRDKKLIEFLFGKMMETNFIEARIENIDLTKHIIDVNIHMNNHEKVIPMELQIDEQKGIIIMSGKIDLINDFDAKEPLYFLHTACFEQHKGKDGKSKTWSEVAVNANIKFDKK
jgi:hypothetical protein